MIPSGITLGVEGILQRIVYPARVRAQEDDLTSSEIDAWVEASEQEYLGALDRKLVERAKGLGVSHGMMLDLGSPLGLIPMKILWEEDELLCIGVYRSLQMAERARRTAEDWNLGDRMFFQVGEPRQMRFKAGYFDMVISDGSLHYFKDPSEILREIRRVTKPSGAILLREFRRPSRFKLSSHIEQHGHRYSPELRNWFEAGVRAGFTRVELLEFARRAEMGRTHVHAENTHLILERSGANDPSSWVTERGKYF
jgi:ubiquinone/menaquinone biosynthesis C-methylase UbiE